MALLGLQSETEAPAHRTNAIVEAEQLDSGGSGTRRERRREMKRAKRPNRFIRKGLANAVDNLRTYPEQVPVSRCGVQVGTTVGCVGLGDLAERNRANEDAIAFDDRQI